MKLTNAESEIKDILADRPYLWERKEDLARAIALAIRKGIRGSIWKSTTEDELFSDALAELNL